MFFDFQFRSLCGIARIPYAAGGLEPGAASCRAAATELFGRKNLEKSTLAGPCFRVPKSAENRLRSKVPPE